MQQKYYRYYYLKKKLENVMRQTFFGDAITSRRCQGRERLVAPEDEKDVEELDEDIGCSIKNHYFK